MNRSNIVWADVETSGLNVKDSYLLEIAVIVTTPELEIIAQFHRVVKYDAEAVTIMREKAAPVVRDMHDKTGLWGRLTSESAKPLEQIDRELHAWLQRFGAERVMPVAGNSVRLDLNFIEEFLPRTYSYLDYHMRDVSTVAGFARDWYDLPHHQKKSDHTALTDIQESIRELKFYRDAVFKPQHGGAFARAQALAAGDPDWMDAAGPAVDTIDYAAEASATKANLVSMQESVREIIARAARDFADQFVTDRGSERWEQEYQRSKQRFTERLSPVSETEYQPRADRLATLVESDTEPWGSRDAWHRALDSALDTASGKHRKNPNNKENPA